MRRNPELVKQVSRLLTTHSLLLLGYTRADGLVRELYNLAKTDAEDEPPGESSAIPASRVYGIHAARDASDSFLWRGQPIRDVQVSEEELLFELMNLQKEE